MSGIARNAVRHQPERRPASSGITVRDHRNTQPSGKSVIKWAKKLCAKRKNSWHDSNIRQRENVHISAKPFHIEYDECGNVVDVGLSDLGYLPIVNAPNPLYCTSEDFVINQELTEIIRQLPSKVGSLKKKRAAEYKRILKLQLSGVDVKPCHGTQLGIKSAEVASLKLQAFNCAGKILSGIFPELKKAQALYKDQKCKKWKIDRSTFEERKGLYRDPNYEEPRLVRAWSVLQGDADQDSANPVLSKGIHKAVNEDIAA